MSKNVLLIGGNGGIGSAMLDHLLNSPEITSVTATSRSMIAVSHPKLTTLQMDFIDEAQIEKVVNKASENLPLDAVIVATGFLHGGNIMPEKSIRDLSRDKFEQQYLINAIGPALVAKYALPKLNKDSNSIFVAFSARVGSISDNALGGWYGYRAAKSALNMILKNLAIETTRTNKNAIIVGLHPGTVDTKLSAPFKSNVPSQKLFTPDYAAEQLLNVIGSLEPKDSGYVFDYKGEKIEP